MKTQLLPAIMRSGFFAEELRMINNKLFIAAKQDSFFHFENNKDQDRSQEGARDKNTVNLRPCYNKNV